MSENGLLSSKNSIVERDSIQEHPEFHPRSRLSEKGSESTYFFHYTLAWARYVAKFCINLLYLLDSKPTIHSIHKFINLHITLIVPAQNYTSTLIESLIYFVNLYIYMIYKSKSFKTKPSILNHNTFKLQSTQNKKSCKQNLELVTTSPPHPDLLAQSFIENNNSSFPYLYLSKCSLRVPNLPEALRVA